MGASSDTILRWIMCELRIIRFLERKFEAWLYEDKVYGSRSVSI